MDKQKLLSSPVRDQYGTDSGSSVAYQRFKGDHPGKAAVHVETQSASTHSTNSKKTLILGPKCSEEISLDDECFEDKAAENELKTAMATIKCTNQDSPWEDPGQLLMVTAGPLLAPKPAETREQHAQYEMEPQRVNQSAPLSQSAMVSLCPIPISESTTGPGAGLLSFGTIVELAVLEH